MYRLRIRRSPRPATSRSSREPGAVVTTLDRAAWGLHRGWQTLLGRKDTEQSGQLWATVRSGHPRFVDAVVADVRITAAHRGDRHEFNSRFDASIQALRLAIVSDAFLAQVCYRAKAAGQARGLPLLPRLFHRLAMMTGQICIGDPVVVQPGVYIPHGQIVVDGVVEIGRGVVLFPFVTVGLQAGELKGPTVGDRAVIGSGAKIVGPVRVGERARVGANAVVLTDVPDDTTVVGIPARPARAKDDVRPPS
jgi:serine O-acetyltransferase